MANTVNVTVVEFGGNNTHLHVFLRSDGVTGDLAKFTIFDPVVYSANKNYPWTRKARFTLWCVQYNFAGFDAIIEFDGGQENPGLDPNFKWVCSEGANAPAKFFHFGGVRDDSGIDGTGKLQLSTSGFNSTADFGSMIIQLRNPGRV